MNRRINRWIPWVAFFLLLTGETFALDREPVFASASSSAEGFPAGAAVDGERFSIRAGGLWKGRGGESNWWWQVSFAQPRDIGAISQITGDHEFVLRNAPRRYVWQGSRDGTAWFDLKETFTESERRLFRLHRLRQKQRVQFLRLKIDAVTGDFPALREAEFFADPKATVPFPDWIVAVNTTHERTLPNHGQEFIPLARSCEGWAHLQAQQVCLDSFDEAFVSGEPRPLCAFLSGNFKDWCEVQRELWRGTQEILRRKRLPIWASCGGAQGLAILAETGVDKPWDCPHCRDPLRPRTPIYTHIGHTAQKPCGDYSGCVFERGPHWIQQIGTDPVFEGLSREFQAMESHCGQIEWPPKGWALIATAGQGTKTRTQCLRVKDRCIYAAQFHIEMAGASETSRRIMANFLDLAKAWGGYNPNGKINR
jgi:F5/8 type C domain